MKPIMKFWTVGDGTHTLVVTQELNTFIERLAKLDAVTRSTRELVAAEESKSATAAHWGHVYKALRALDGE